jgi:hypothetical protein
VRNQRRSERVVLKMPVVVRVQTSAGERTDERAYTVVVNAHGGLLRLEMELTPGQTMNLANPKTHAEESCRVVRVENLPAGNFAVAFEFWRPSPQFWPIVFPPTDWESVEV